MYPTIHRSRYFSSWDKCDLSCSRGLGKHILCLILSTRYLIMTAHIRRWSKSRPRYRTIDSLGNVWLLNCRISLWVWRLRVNGTTVHFHTAFIAPYFVLLKVLLELFLLRKYHLLGDLCTVSQRIVQIIYQVQQWVNHAALRYAWLHRPGSGDIIFIFDRERSFTQAGLYQPVVDVTNMMFYFSVKILMRNLWNVFSVSK